MKAILYTLLALAQVQSDQQSTLLKKKSRGVLIGLSVATDKQAFAAIKNTKGSYMKNIRTGKKYTPLKYLPRDAQVVNSTLYYAQSGSNLYRFEKIKREWEYKYLPRADINGKLTDFRVHKGDVYATYAVVTIPATTDDADDDDEDDVDDDDEDDDDEDDEDDVDEQDEEDDKEDDDEDIGYLTEAAEYKTNLYKLTGNKFVFLRSIGGYVHSFAIHASGKKWYAIRDKRPGQKPKARFLTKALVKGEKVLHNEMIHASFSQLAIDRKNHLFFANNETVQHWNSGLDPQEIIQSPNHEVQRLAIVSKGSKNTLYLGGRCDERICFSRFSYKHYNKYAR